MSSAAARNFRGRRATMCAYCCPMTTDPRAHSREVVEQVADGAAHIGLLLGTSVPDGITARSLYKVPIIGIAHRDHPVAASRPLRLGDLATHRLAVHSLGEPAPANWRKCCAQPGSPPTGLLGFTLRARTGSSTVMSPSSGRRCSRPASQRPPGPVRIASLPDWSLDVAAAYRDGCEQRAASNVIQILTSTGNQIAATLPRSRRPARATDAGAACVTRDISAPSCKSFVRNHPRPRT